MNKAALIGKVAAVQAILSLSSACAADYLYIGDPPPAEAWSTNATAIRLQSNNLTTPEVARGMTLFSRNIQQRGAPLTVTLETITTRVPPANELIVRLALTDLDGDPSQGAYTLTLAPEGEGAQARIEAEEPLGIIAGLGELLWLSQPSASGGVTFHESNATGLREPYFAVRNAFGPIGAHGDGDAATRTGSTGWLNQQQLEDYAAGALLLGNNLLFDGAGSNQRVSMKTVTTTGYNNNWHRYSTFADGYAAQYVLGISANAIHADDRVSSETNVVWPFTHSIFARLGCPSDPPTRAVMLQEREVYFDRAPRIDWVLLLAGDIAGCRCVDCRPWGATYLDLAADMATDLKSHHANARFLINNTWLSPEEDEVLFNDLADIPPSQIDGYFYAPGSDEGSTYGFMPGLEEWQSPQDTPPPGTHPDDLDLAQRRFFRSVRDQLATSGHKSIEYADITHWKNAQYGMEDRSHPLWLELNLRRSYMPRPQAMYSVIAASLAHQDRDGGMMAYSEGVHDDLHKFMLSRMLWNPNDRNARQLVEEYYTYYAGPTVAPVLTDATFAAERWHRSAPSEVGLLNEVRRTRVSLEAAVPSVPAVLRNGWRLQLLRERVALDLYSLLKFQQQAELFDDVMEVVTEAAETMPVDVAALNALAQQIDAGIHAETAEMTSLRTEIQQIDDLLNASIGLRFDVFHRLDKIDTAGLVWLRKAITDAIAAPNDATRRARLATAVDYHTGRNALILADLGAPEGKQFLKNPRAVRHYYGEGDESLTSHPAKRSFVYTHEEIAHIDLEFHGLDSSLDHQVVLTHPNPVARFYSKDSPNRYRVLAGPQLLNLGTVSPAGTAGAPQDFTFQVPASAIVDGSLSLRLEQFAGQCRSISVAEIRILKPNV
jgi:hypothetical protein